MRRLFGYVVSALRYSLARRVRHAFDQKASIGTGSGRYGVKARVMAVTDGKAQLPYRCVYRLDDTVSFTGADGCLLQEGRCVELVLERSVLRPGAAAWGRLTQVTFDAPDDDAQHHWVANPYSGVTFRLQPA